MNLKFLSFFEIKKIMLFILFIYLLYIYFILFTFGVGSLTQSYGFGISALTPFQHNFYLMWGVLYLMTSSFHLCRVTLLVCSPSHGWQLETGSSFLTIYWYIKSKLAGNLLKGKSKLKPLLRKAVVFRGIPRDIKQ